VRWSTCIGLAMAIGNLRPDNADQSELSQLVGQVSDRHGRLACVQRQHDPAFCPYGSDLGAPLEPVGAFFFAGLSHHSSSASMPAFPETFHTWLESIARANLMAERQQLSRA
jgi:hypothetical protein